MKIYRGIFDIMPDKIDPVFMGQGSFGDGTYYAFDEDTALAYCLDAKFFGILYEAEIDVTNNIELHSEKVEGLKGYRGDAYVKSKLLGTVDKELLTEKILNMGFSSVSLKGIIDGGEQLIVLDRRIPIKIIAYKLIIKNTNQSLININQWLSCTHDNSYIVSSFLTIKELENLLHRLKLDCHLL
jgi:hypothetical protein